MVATKSLASRRIEARRRAVIRRRKMIAVLSVLAISLIILFGSAMITFAKSNGKNEPVKEFVSIQIQTGDSLWTIAESYTESYGVAINDYIDEVKSVNGLTSNDIQTGSFIIVPTYHFNN